MNQMKRNTQSIKCNEASSKQRQLLCLSQRKMSHNYDNWEKIVTSVLRKEQDRDLSLLDDLTSCGSTSTGESSGFPSFRLSNSSFLDQSLVQDHNGNKIEPYHVSPPLPDKYDCEIDPTELDFSNSVLIEKGTFGEILKACWKGTKVAVKRILPNLSDDMLAMNEVNLRKKLRHPNIVQFLGAITEKKPLMLITEYLSGGDLHKYLKEKGALNHSTAVNFALDIVRGMTCLHNGPNVIIHRDLKPRLVALMIGKWQEYSPHRLNWTPFENRGLQIEQVIKLQNPHDVYEMTGKIGSYRYMAPEVFKHRKYNNKVDVFSFAMILYEMIEGEPPLSHYDPYEATRYMAEGHRPTFRRKVFFPEFKELIEQCWAADMNQRPTFFEILKTLEKIKEMVPYA